MVIINAQVSSDTVSAAVFRTALTNFDDLDQRLADFPNLAPRYLQVHQKGQTSATVTEGSTFAGGVWEQLRYDWADPMVVRLTVIASNTFAAGSTWVYQVKPGHDGVEITLRVDRKPTSFKGRLLLVPLTVFGRQIFTADLSRTLEHLEARTAGSERPPNPAR